MKYRDPKKSGCSQTEVCSPCHLEKGVRPGCFAFDEDLHQSCNDGVGALRKLRSSVDPVAIDDAMPEPLLFATLLTSYMFDIGGTDGGSYRVNRKRQVTLLSRPKGVSSRLYFVCARKVCGPIYVERFLKILGRSAKVPANDQNHDAVDRLLRQSETAPEKTAPEKKEPGEFTRTFFAGADSSSSGAPAPFMATSHQQVSHSQIPDPQIPESQRATKISQPQSPGQGAVSSGPGDFTKLFGGFDGATPEPPSVAARESQPLFATNDLKPTPSARTEVPPVASPQPGLPGEFTQTFGMMGTVPEDAGTQDSGRFTRVFEIENLANPQIPMASEPPSEAFSSAPAFGQPASPPIQQFPPAPAYDAGARVQSSGPDSLSKLFGNPLTPPASNLANSAELARTAESGQFTQLFNASSLRAEPVVEKTAAPSGFTQLFSTVEPSAPSVHPGLHSSSGDSTKIFDGGAPAKSDLWMERPKQETIGGLGANPPFGSAMTFPSSPSGTSSSEQATNIFAFGSQGSGSLGVADGKSEFTRVISGSAFQSSPHGTEPPAQGGALGSPAANQQPSAMPPQFQPPAMQMPSWSMPSVPVPAPASMSYPPAHPQPPQHAANLPAWAVPPAPQIPGVSMPSLQPPALSASPPPQPQPANKWAAYLPLIIGLNVLVVLAIVLILIFAMGPKH